MMRAALVSGLRAAVQRTPLVLLMWQVNLVFGGVFGALGATTLAVTLDRSRFTRSLLYDLDLNVFAALVAHAAPTLKLLGASAITLGVLYIVAWLALHGAAVASICRSEDATLSASLQAGARFLGVFSRIFCLALGTTGLALGGLVVAMRMLLRLAREAAAEGMWELVLFGGVAVGALLLVFCIAAHDHARIRSVTSGDGAWRSYLWSLRFVSSGRQRAFQLAIWLQLLSVAAWGVYQLIASHIAADWMTGTVLAFIWGETLMLVRQLLRLWSFAAQARLQEEGLRTQD